MKALLIPTHEIRGKQKKKKKTWKLREIIKNVLWNMEKDVTGNVTSQVYQSPGPVAFLKEIRPPRQKNIHLFSNIYWGPA